MDIAIYRLNPPGGQFSEKWAYGRQLKFSGCADSTTYTKEKKKKYQKLIGVRSKYLNILKHNDRVVEVAISKISTWGIRLREDQEEQYYTSPLL